MEQKAQIGLIGVGTMGSNFALNFANNNFTISVFDRTPDKTKAFLKDHPNSNITGQYSIKEFVNSLEKPNKIILFIQAGEPVDLVIKQLIPYIKENDIILDCGNSNYKDTQRRFNELKKQNIEFIGCGVSGGEEGALKGPSLMPGGSKKAWNQVKNMFNSVAAKDFHGDPCVTYIGDNGAGHFIKTIHNGIEYGIMQIISEAYYSLKEIYQLPTENIAKIFEKLNKGKLGSFLFETAISVLNKKDNLTKNHLLEMIMDKAAQKGTGTWTAKDAIDTKTATPTISEAINARFLSNEKDLRTQINKTLKSKTKSPEILLEKFYHELEDALYASIISTYAQGFHLITNKSKEENWKISLSEVSRIWEGGCIIRAKLLEDIHIGYEKETIEHLFLNKDISKKLLKTIPSLENIVSYTSLHSLPNPGFSSALNYIQSLRSKYLPANFIQGLRDNFGAHTYERTDKKGIFHTEW